MSARAFKDALRGADQVEVTVTGRKSGRAISIPLRFAQEGDMVYLLPDRGSDNDWYNNLRKTPTIHLEASAAEWTGQARPITDPDMVNHVIEDFRSKYGPDVVERGYAKFDAAVEVPLA